VQAAAAWAPLPPDTDDKVSSDLLIFVRCSGEHTTITMDEIFPFERL
jgi:hypothetical protein